MTAQNIAHLDFKPEFICEAGTCAGDRGTAVASMLKSCGCLVMLDEVCVGYYEEFLKKFGEDMTKPTVCLDCKGRIPATQVSDLAKVVPL